MECFDVDSDRGGMWARHGCAGDYVIEGLPRVCDSADGRNGRPCGQNFNSRRSQIRLYEITLNQYGKYFMNNRSRSKPEEKLNMVTLRMSKVSGFGPLEEKETTKGADVSFTALLFKMVAVAALYIQKYIHQTSFSFTG